MSSLANLTSVHPGHIATAGRIIEELRTELERKSRALELAKDFFRGELNFGALHQVQSIELTEEDLEGVDALPGGYE